MDSLKGFSTRATVQTEQADERQVQNNAGGYTFTVTPTMQVRRFLILGGEGTYYQSGAELTADNARAVVNLAKSDHAALRKLIEEVSIGGLAPKVQPALFALAIAVSHGSTEDRGKALAMLPKIARTGYHLFMFATYVQQFRGWGRGLRRAVASWYLDMPVDRLAYQMVKYRQREGWTHRDLLRLSHPVTADPERRMLLAWGVGADAVAKELEVSGPLEAGMPEVVVGYEAAQREGANAAALVKAYSLPWEALTDAQLSDPETWKSLLDNRRVPVGALIRQLPKLTRLGVTRERRDEIVSMVTNVDLLRSGRVHPFNVLLAQRTYASGVSLRGSSTWEPDPYVTDALTDAFHLAFKAVEPTGKRYLLALDVSGSMGGSYLAGTPVTAREGSAAMALTTMNVERKCDVVGFTGGDMWGANGSLSTLKISPRQRLDDVCRYMSALPFGRTDCSLPMLYAAERKLDYDVFVVYTDNETWSGGWHPHEALRRYREQSGINAKLVVVGMTATRFTIADPTDPGMLDVVGMDPSVPQAISAFATLA